MKACSSGSQLISIGPPGASREAHHRARHHARAGRQLVLVDDVAELLDRLRRIVPDAARVVERRRGRRPPRCGCRGSSGRRTASGSSSTCPRASRGRPRGCPAARPRRRGARPRSGRACPTSGRASPSKRSSPTRSQPCQQPVCASRLVSKNTRPWRRMNCAFSSTAGIAPRHSRSQAMPCSFSSMRKRRRFSGSSTSTWNGPTRVSMRSPSCLRRAHHAVAVAALHAGEGVLGGQVRVLAHAHHHEQLVGRGVQVEVVAVVEVAVAGRDVAHRLAGLVDREVVPGREHGGLLAARAATRQGLSLPTIQVEKYCEPPP